MADEWQDLANAEDFPPGKRVVVDVDGTDVAVLNVGGTFFAIEDRCSHDNASLGDGVVRDDEIVCPRHGARFCLRSGAALSPPAYEGIAVYPVRLVDGRIQIRREPGTD